MTGPEEIVTILGKGSAFDGKLTFEGTVRIDGDFSGEIRTEGTLIVGESATVKAEIDASIIRVEGRVDGQLRAETRVELSSTANVRGTLRSPSLEIERGAVFDGDCVMRATAEADASASEPEAATTSDAPDADA